MPCPGMGWETRIFSQDHDETAGPPSTVPDWDDNVSTNTNVVYEEEIVSESIKETVNKRNFAGLSGSQHMDQAREKTTTIDVAGSLNFESVHPHNLHAWLYRIMHKRPSGTTFTVGTTEAEFGLLIERAVDRTGGSSLFEYLGCQVQRCVLTSSEGEPLKMTIDVIGKTATNNLTSGLSVPATGGTNYTEVPATIAGDPYFMWSGVLDGFSDTDLPINDFSLTIENVLNIRRHNSQTVSQICLVKQNITLDVNADWALTYVDNVHDGGIATDGTLTFTNSTVSCTITFGALVQRAQQDPSVSDAAAPIPYAMSFTALDNGATAAISIVNDKVV